MSAVLEYLRVKLQHEMWFPSWIGLLINPFYFARKGLLEQLRACGHYVSGITLDIGCGSQPYRSLYAAKHYFGIEIFRALVANSPASDLVYDGKHFPVATGSLDSVVLNQVLEHVFCPNELLGEIYRMLQDDGILLISVPFVWDEHEQPWDYARYSSFGLKYLLEQHGFIIVEQRKSVTDLRVVFQMLNAYLYKISARHSKKMRILTTLLLIAPFNMIGALLGWLLPSNTDLYLDNIVVARKGFGKK